MKQRSKKNFLLLGLFFLYIVFFVVYISKNLLKYSESITAAFLILITFFAVLLLGYRKDKTSILKKSLFNLVLSAVIFFFVVIYLYGLFFGFLKTPYNLSFFGILNNIISPLVILVCSELFRYILISSNKDKKHICISTTIILIFLEMTFNLNIFHFDSLSSWFKIISSCLLHLTAKNALLSYLSFYAGYKPGIVYRLIMDMYIYVLPIVPDLGDYIECIAMIVLPFFIYLKSSEMVEYYENTFEREFKVSKSLGSEIATLIPVILLAVLTSGFFPWKLLGVGSESMEPKINKGDAVFAVKTNVNELQIGDIIVFEQQDKEIIHRISDIIEEDGSLYFITKGDNNNSEDDWRVSPEDIHAKVYGHIPWIAYPSIYIKELVEEK